MFTTRVSQHFKRLLRVPGARVFITGALAASLGVACTSCEKNNSSGGPKIKVTPDPLPATSPATPGTEVTEVGRGVHVYPAADTTPPPVSAPVGLGTNAQLQRLIVVDQFGYLPAMKKVAVLADPVHGWNGNSAFEPGPELEVREWKDGSVVFTGKPSVWNSGKVDEASGDRGAWFDFSALKTPGLYYVYDRKSYYRSHPFEIGPNVYRNALVAAMKMFYFNRANFEKKPPYSCVGKRCWSLGADYLGPRQDTEARSIEDPENAGTSRDLSGGWWDAGDTNKYVTFANQPIHTLLTAYEERPKVFDDDFGIPESGNGIPDVLDEVKRELEWFKRMQPEDLKGGVLIKVGNVEHNDPIPDKSRMHRFYYSKPCSASTIVAASVFAHAALVYRKLDGQGDFVKDLTQRSISAYDWFFSHPKDKECDSRRIKSGDADMPIEEQDQLAVVAAIYLYSLTGNAKYGDYVKGNYSKTRPYKDDRWSVYEPSQGDALLYYASLPNADPTTKGAILGKKRAEAGRLEFYGFKPQLDLYRAYLREDSYHWGSNRARAAYATTNYDMVQHNLAAPVDRASFEERAAGLLHSLHGVNAMQIMYLTNMYGLGGDDCADEMFHTWFRDADPKWDNARTSQLGPAPGYLTGGPNAQYCLYVGDEDACKHSPVREQPRGKAYLDSNKGWDPKSPFDKTWELTEPGIYYQAAYVRLVSKFVN